jgi:glycosyltransferase involved in cell wall biosynthesis
MDADALSEVNQHTLMQKKFSVIICCHNSEKRVGAALAAVFAQTGDAPEVILVDNNCTDLTIGVARKVADECGRSLTIVPAPIPGLIHARRAGALAASGDYVCFVDDDNRLDPEYLARAAGVFEQHPDVGYLGGVSRLPDTWTVPNWLDSSMLLAYAVGRQHDADGRLRGTTPLLWGAGLCVRTPVLKEVLQDIDQFKCVGRVGAKQLAGDDSELCYRIAWKHWAGYFDESLTLIHAIDPSRFTEQRYIEMHRGFGTAKPILDTLEFTLQRHTAVNVHILARNLLYHAPTRVLVYALLALRWSLRPSASVATRAKAAFYRAALISSLLLMRTKA